MPVAISLRQFPEQRHSEDVSLSVPIVHARVSALSAVTVRVSPEACGQHSAVQEQPSDGRGRSCKTLFIDSGRVNRRMLC